MIQKKKILLFQKSLRKHIMNFGINLRQFEFVCPPKNIQLKKNRKKIESIEEVFKMKKTTFLSIVRRIVGIPNIRIKFTDSDLLFTYGTLLLTNKPYCAYVENGLALFNYDIKIAKNPIARLIFKMFVYMKNCRKLIFMSETAKISFFSTLKFNKKTEQMLRNKSIQCYPLIKNNFENISKSLKDNEPLKFLFAGSFYLKGGLEMVNAFANLHNRYENSRLTIITELDGIKQDDLNKIRQIKGVVIYDTKFNEREMFDFFNNNHVFLLPTFRDSFGLVLIEALSAGMPIIANDQYATREMVINDYNGFIFLDHPMKDYDSKTYELYGKLSEPYIFYNRLFKLQSENKTEELEKFLFDSMEKFILNPVLIEKFSKNSLKLYNNKFHYQLISDRIESVFDDALKNNC